MKREPDESKIYDKVIAEGFIRENEPSFSELLALGKYIRQTKGYGEKNIIKWLVEFCKRDNEFFNSVTSSNLLGAVARAVIKNTEFRKINFPIKIFQGEIDLIRKIRNFKYQIILLASLVVAKSSGNPKLFSDKPNQIFHIIDISGETFSNKRFIEELSHIAHTEGIFTFVGKRYQFYALTCDETGGTSIEISNEADYYNLSEVYREFIGGELMWCEECGIENFKINNRHIYCLECSKSRTEKREKSRERKSI